MEKKNPGLILLQAGMILPAAVLFSIKTDLPHVLAFTVLALIVSLFMRTTIHLSDRTVIYSTLTCVLTAFIFDYVFPINEGRYGVLDGVFRTNFTVPVLLYGAVTLTYFPFRNYSIGLSAGMTLIALLCSGDILGGREANEFIPFDTFVFNHIYGVYACCITIHICFLVLCLEKARTPAVSGIRFRYFSRLRNIIRAFSLIGIPITVGLIVFFFIKNEKLFIELENFLLRTGLRQSFNAPSKTVFRDKVELNSTISPEFEKNRDKVVLRAISTNPPGYLRGRVYTVYSKGAWSRPETDKVKLPAERRVGTLSYSTFSLPDFEKTLSDSDYYRINILTDNSFLSDVLLLPGNVRQIDAVADNISVEYGGCFVPDSWRKDGAYTALCSSARQDSAFQSPPPEPKTNRTLQVPGNVRPVVKAFTDEICNKLNSKKNNMETVFRIMKFLRENYTYSLDFIPDPKEDPLIYFLKEKKQAHCELFATAAVMMLRVRGIHARYVTGFYVEEMHPSGAYYVGRIGNAHAWVEAWIENEQRWILIEPTPPTGIPNFKYEWGKLESWSDWIREIYLKAFADLRRGYFADAMIFLFASATNYIYFIVWHPVRGVAVVGIILALILFRYIHRKKLKPIATPEPMKILRKEFAKLEKKAMKIAGLSRENSMTVNEWIQSLDHNGDPASAALKNALAAYVDVRYSTPSPDPDKLRIFREKAAFFMSRKFDKA